MVTTTAHLLTPAQLAAEAATLAPSVHNTQPWRITVRADGLDLFVDRSRALPVLDPTGREAMISVGCALLNARVSLTAEATAGRVTVDRFPDPSDTDHVASLTLDPRPSTDGDSELAALRPAVDTRHSNRRRFTEETVPLSVVRSLVFAAAAEDATLVPVLSDEHRATVARLTQHADREQNSDPAYRAEIRRWTSSNPDRFDGLDPSVVPHVDGNSQDDVPIRDFDTTGDGELPSLTRSSLSQRMFLLCTVDDTPAACLRSGEALQRVLLEVTRLGYVASLFTQPIEVDHVRDRLRDELHLMAAPMVLIRVGRAPISPATARFPLSEVLTRG